MTDSFTWYSELLSAWYHQPYIIKRLFVFRAPHFLYFHFFQPFLYPCNLSHDICSLLPSFITCKVKKTVLPCQPTKHNLHHSQNLHSTVQEFTKWKMKYGLQKRKTVSDQLPTPLLDGLCLQIMSSEIKCIHPVDATCNHMYSCVKRKKLYDCANVCGGFKTNSANFFNEILTLKKKKKGVHQYSNSPTTN